MNDEVEQRIEAAAQAAQRQKDTKEFMESLTKDTELVKPIYNPEAYVLREKARGLASRGEMPKSDCTHPLRYIQQYIDDDPSVLREGKPVNLFECGICHIPIWFVDPWGNPLTDD